MSTRQNKKQRKGRNNAHNRERTVTTLTEDPNTHYLVPTPSEEPAGSHMPAFGGGKMHNNNVSMGPPQSYQVPNNYGGFGFNASYPPVPNMHQQRQHQPQPFFSSPPQRSQQPPQQQQQQQQHSQMPDLRLKVPLPPGKNDLEILQNLKKIIKDNQHPFFKAVPDPTSLAKLYKGKISGQSGQTAHGSQQAPSGSRNESGDGSVSQAPSSTSGLGQSSAEVGRRPRPPVTGKDRRSIPSGGNQGNNSFQGSQGGRYNNPPVGNSVANLNLQNLKITPSDATPPSGGAHSESRASEMTSTGPSQSAGDRRGYEYSGRYPKPDSASGGRPHDSRHDNMATDGSMPSKGYMYSGKDDGYRPRGWGSRDYPHPDDRDFDPDRNMAQRPPGGSGNVDARQLSGPDRAGPPGDVYDRDRSRRDWNDRDRDRRLSHDRHDSRVTDNRRSSAIADQRPFEADYGQPPARRGTAEPPVPPDARHVSENPPAGERPPVDSRVNPRATPARAPDRLGLETEDIQSSRASSVRPMDAGPALASVPPAPAGNDVADDSSGRPTLKERMNPPAHSSRTPTDNYGEQTASAYNPERSKQPKPQQKDRGHGRPTSPSGGRPPPMSGDRGYGRPPSPSGGPPPTMSGGPAPPPRSFQPRSPSIEGRSSKGGPASRGGPRDFRGPGRSMSRDRGGSYRPEFHDSRYLPSGMDVDGPPPRYEGRPYRDFSPALSGGRGPPPGDGPPGRDYPSYPPPRREWGPDEDDYYKHSRNWDGPPHERGRYERDYGAPARSGGWSERDFVPREAYPPGPPGVPVDDRYPPGPPIRDGRPPPPGYNNPPFNSRVRPRSPSPVRRPGPGSVDDSRPPLKRSREDFSADYYRPGSRDGMRRPPGEYPAPPRSGSPGPSNSGWAPPSGSSGTSSLPPGIAPSGDRDFRLGRDSMDYAPPGSGGYDRRSPGPPGPSGGRGPYNRGGGGGGGGYGRGGGEPRDRGGYGMQRP